MSFMISKSEQQQHIFTNRMIRNLLIPVVLEQLLNSIMGTADTMMVSNVGSAAISAVSLVDSINVLVIQAFSALAAGGAIVCAQYIGQRNKEKANESARQVLFIITAISLAVSLICLIFQKPLLGLIFGSVDAEVMRASETYFFYTALSFPFIAAYDSAASIFQCDEHCRKCSYDLGFPYGSYRCGTFHTDLTCVLCSCGSDSASKRQTGDCCA